ncbi:MAG: hypothetical protein FWF97_03805 [Alphaproteobacteria bacterium]|nr:hypothetical protein [Alphaproteobacteria bacterium]
MKRFAFSILFLMTLIPMVAYGAVTGVKMGGGGGAPAAVVKKSGASPAIPARAATSGTVKVSTATVKGETGIKSSGTGMATARAGAIKQISNDLVAEAVKLDQFFSDEAFYIILDGISGQFSFQMSAMGNFGIDWGDGNAERIERLSTTLETYSHKYEKSGTYKIRLSGLATGYSSDVMTAAISFENSTNKNKMVEVVGDMGAVFPILRRPADGTFGTPRFVKTFYGCAGLNKIPNNLFYGLNGAPVSSMFNKTFYGCNNLTGEIPGDLFSGIRGAPAEDMFNSTFTGCKVTGIGDGLFDGISGATRSGMFTTTFQNCTSLTGPSATSGGQFLYEKWPDANSFCYSGATGLEDYCAIPANWGGNPSAPECDPISINPILCQPGHYVPANTLYCAPCIGGSYCPGGSFEPEMHPVDRGINLCPAPALFQFSHATIYDYPSYVSVTGTPTIGSSTPMSSIANCYMECDKNKLSITNGTITGTLFATAKWGLSNSFSDNYDYCYWNVECDSGFQQPMQYVPLCLPTDI